MVKVKMLKTAAGPKGNFLAGKKYQMDEKLAAAFKKDNACEILGKVKEEDSDPSGEDSGKGKGKNKGASKE